MVWLDCDNFTDSHQSIIRRSYYNDPNPKNLPAGRAPEKDEGDEKGGAAESGDGGIHPTHIKQSPIHFILTLYNSLIHKPTIYIVPQYYQSSRGTDRRGRL
jgi:hypothetical protein